MTDTAAALLGDNGTPAAPAAGVQPTAQPAPNSVWTAAFDEDTNAYVSNKGWKEPSDQLGFGSVVLEKFRHGQPRLKLDSVHRHDRHSVFFDGDHSTVGQAQQMSLADVHC